MLSLGLYTVPQREGTLGSYVKFGAGRVVHTSTDLVWRYISYYNDRAGIGDKLLAVELMPAFDKSFGAHKAVLDTVKRRGDLSDDEAAYIYDLLVKGMKS